MSNKGKTEQNKEGHPLCTVAPQKKGGLPHFEHIQAEPMSNPIPFFLDRWMDGVGCRTQGRVQDEGGPRRIRFTLVHVLVLYSLVVVLLCFAVDMAFVLSNSMRWSHPSHWTRPDRQGRKSFLAVAFFAHYFFLCAPLCSFFPSFLRSSRERERKR